MAIFLPIPCKLPLISILIFAILVLNLLPKFHHRLIILLSKKFLGSPITNSFVCDEISYTEIHEKSFKQKHKPSKGPDAISSKFIFELEEVFLEPIFLIFNLSLRLGVFPDHLKIAKILPLFKKTDKLLVTNYRPISLLNSMSKLFEAIMADRLTSFFNKYNLFYKFQFGFRKNHSTKLALLSALDDILDPIANRRHVAAIFFDLSKAFNTIDRGILLDKLYHYGIRGITFKWLQSYLSSRSQYVELNGVVVV